MHSPFFDSPHPTPRKKAGEASQAFTLSPELPSSPGFNRALPWISAIRSALISVPCFLCLLLQLTILPLQCLPPLTAQCGLPIRTWLTTSPAHGLVHSRSSESENRRQRRKPEPQASKQGGLKKTPHFSRARATPEAETLPQWAGRWEVAGAGGL